MSPSTSIKKEKIDYGKLNIKFIPSPGTKIKFKTFGQLITRARLEKKPLIIVEGLDDVGVYEQLAIKAEKKVSVRAVETFEGYSEGCESVKEFITNAQTEINKSPQNDKYILGIIDRDSSFYRGQQSSLSSLKCLLILRAYSYESHFVTRDHVNYAIKNFINSQFGVNDKILDYVLKDFCMVTNKLYYIALEALKNACIKNYNGLIGYSSTYGQINNQSQVIEQILNKAKELDQFATNRGISKQDIHLVIKGKWLFEAFIESLFNAIKQLSENCKNDVLIEGQQRCQFCESGKFEKCSWKIKKGNTKNYLSNLVFQFICVKETGYILDRMKKLA